MAKKFKGWFQCYFCPVETDQGKLVEYKGKMRKICKRCYEDKIYLKEKKNEIRQRKQKD